MSEKWGISRVGKLELEVGDTLQEAITSTLKAWCFPGGKPTVTLRVLKPTRDRNYRPSLTRSRKSSPNQNTPKRAGPE